MAEVKTKIKTEKKHRRSLLIQVAYFFVISLLLTGMLSLFVLDQVSDRSVQIEKEALAAHTAKLIRNNLREYRSYRWIIKYWLEHKDELDLEYDQSYKTDQKEIEFYGKYPDITINTVLESDLEKLPEEDQKMVAEIAFNHMLLEMNSIKEAFDVNFLYLVAVSDDFKTSTYLISASDGKRKRGTEKGNAYILGTTKESTPDQQKIYRNINKDEEHHIITKDNIDLYGYFEMLGEYELIIGVTFDLKGVRNEVAEGTVKYISVFVLLQVILSATCLLLIYIYAIKPLKRVNKNINEYGETKDSENVVKQLSEIKSRNEIGDLADSFSEMVSEIDEHLEKIQSITAEKERIGAELVVATQIQADMLPRIFPPFPDVKEIDVYATMDPAKEVGGDFYDFFMVDDDHVALVVADVSGKGVPASLFMAISKSLIKSRTLLGGSTSEILYDVNNQLCEGNEAALFVTVWLAIVDIRTGEGIASNAGHEHPVLRKAGGRYEIVEYKHSMALGMIEDIRFEEHTFKVEPGDRIFSYSDGVPEATNISDELYGNERMLAALNREPEASLKQTLMNLKNDMDNFVGEATQFDDITMLVFDFYSKKDSV